MKKVGLVTYQGAPALTGDDALLLSHLYELGIEALPVVWDAPHISWTYFDALVVRSCWDYHRKVHAFRDWLSLIEESDIPLWNSAETIRWNLDKKYLQELETSGVKIPQTIWIEPGVSLDLRLLLLDNGLNQAVVKPTISGSADRTWRTSEETAQSQQRQLGSLLRTSGALIQAFIDQLTTTGEWSLVFLGGDYSHAVLKKPKAGDFRVQAEFGGNYSPAVPAQELINQAEAIIRLVDRPLLYARVDGVAIDGQFTLLELELVEPELFLGLHPLAPQRFAEAINAVLGK